VRNIKIEKEQGRKREREKKKRERERKQERGEREKEGTSSYLFHSLSYVQIYSGIFFLSYTINLKVRDELTLKHHLLLKHSSITVFYFDICCDFKNIYSATFFNNLIQY